MLTIDPQQLRDDIATLAQFVEPETPGTTRRAFTDTYRAGRVWLRERMQSAGLTVTQDASANLIGRRAGTTTAPPVLIGSHTDTVMGGGRFDGVIGVLGAIAVARALCDAGVVLRHPLEVVDFLAEESTPLGSLFGSTAMAQGFSAEFLARDVPGWGVVGDAIAGMGGDPSQLLHPLRRSGEIAAYLELHIEQGPVLEAAQVPIGAVTGIVGIRRADIVCTGRPDHAGTASMAVRHDALATVADIIRATEQAALARPGTVATVGSLHVAPNQTNVVPGQVRFSVEMRSLHWPEVLSMWDEIVAAIHLAGAQRGVAVQIGAYEDSAPLQFPVWMRQIVTQACGRFTHQVVELPSGAGHDGSMIGLIAPAAMIFVRTKDGRSHCPEEFAAHDDIVAGVNALLQAVLAIDARIEE